MQNVFCKVVDYFCKRFITVYMKKNNISDEQWMLIKDEYCKGMSVDALSKHFDIPYQTIYHKVKRKKWVVNTTFYEESKVIDLVEFKKNKRRQSVIFKQFRYKELSDAINFTIEMFSRGLESKVYELIKQRYPEKRITYYMIDVLKRFARKRIKKILDIQVETMVHEYIIRMDLLYNMALKENDVKTACYVSEQKAKVLGLHNAKEKSDYDIDADITKRIKEFDELNTRLERDITPPTISDIMK